MNRAAGTGALMREPSKNAALEEMPVTRNDDGYALTILFEQFISHKFRPRLIRHSDNTAPAPVAAAARPLAG